MNHSFYILLSSAIEGYAQDYKALSLYRDFQQSIIHTGSQNNIDLSLKELGYPLSNEIYYSNEGFPIGIEWKCPHFDPISAWKELEDPTSNHHEVASVNFHNFKGQLDKALKDYNPDTWAAAGYLEHWQLGEHPEQILDNRNPEYAELVNSMHLVSDAIQVLASARQIEIGEVLQKAGYKHPNDVVYDNEGMPWANWKCPNFDCTSFFESTSIDNAEQ